jgi:hypothetical protein
MLSSGYIPHRKVKGRQFVYADPSLGEGQTLFGRGGDAA